MAPNCISLLVFFITIFAFSTIVESSSRARMYLESECRLAMYPDLCVRTLLPYVDKSGILSPQRLAQLTLASCLSKARVTKTYVDTLAHKLNDTGNFGEYQALVTCMHQIDNGVNQIMQSLKELQHMGSDGDENFVWHESNVQSWVSAALTDITTCIDGISGDGIGRREKAMMEARFFNVKQLASNSLMMFSRFTTKFRASRGIKNP
ncbi:pectinesterase inhibitor 9-like [Rutidosis leptorrhynchoides]|uniref:pectinesterase inhibitor 9-like n=1 Tax=Rutidosis leptorrhynchoides TaxID=125765 RepID=UPI003A9A01AF